PIGDYNATLTLTDDNAHTSKSQIQPLHVPDYAHLQVGMSGILLASNIADVNGKKSITPYVMRNAGGLKDGLFLFFEVYDKKQSDTLDVVYLALKADGDEALRGARIPLYVTGTRSAQFIKLPTQLLSQGRYVIKLGLFPHVADTSAPAGFDTAYSQASHTLTVDWGYGVPQTTEDMDKAIEQLRWVATSDQIDSMESAPTLAEKRARFEGFWKRLDPTPGTPANEAMELYYSRVRYANEHFKSLGEGWASDRGMVYIIFGAPSSEEDHPFDYITSGMYHGPYMIWYYDRYGRQYVFIDQDGFGDFRLASPMPIERFRYGY
ncbi:MAG TPA: GWxTD domain-containing protein, partial [Candidatus Kapabacteria bacterium]|nr:GWxTD domain-containing protein [Candidatus Kapabacteria bacterium]